MSPRELVLQQALALPKADQAFVARSIEDHLAAEIPNQIDESEAESAAEFLAELERRSASDRAGEVQSRDAEVVMRELWLLQMRETQP